jgi:O-antigen ligase
VGQIAARYEINPLLKIVPDGDYLRIASELGIIGILFYIILFLLLFFSFFNLNANKKRFILISLLVGYSFQMIGSNITEFYFTNFIYWIIIGYLFNDIQVHKTYNISNTIISQ